MKKVYSTIMMFAIMIAVLSLVGCSSSDDEEDIDDNNSIVGLWECTYYDVHTTIPNYTKQTEVGDRIRFNSDGTYSTDKETGKWKQNGNTLTVMLDAEIVIPVDYKIEKLTSTELELSCDIGILSFYMKLKRVS